MQLKKYLLIIFASIALSACYSGMLHQELQGGKSEFQYGDFKDSFQTLYPLAMQGIDRAQYAIGYMYYNGYGIKQDTRKAICWIEAAARQNYGPAVKARCVIRRNAEHNSLLHPHPKC